MCAEKMRCLGKRRGNNVHQAVRMVVPSQDWHTAALGSHYTACCESDGPVTWRKRGDNFNLECHTSIVADIYVSKVILKTLTYRDVGFYDCLLSDTSDDSSVTNASFYLYVDDPVHLRLGPRSLKAYSESFRPAVVPCRPTAPDVFVKLLNSKREIMADSTNQSPGPGKKNIYFDPCQGFIMPAHLMQPDWFFYICEFSKQGVIQEMNVNLYVSKDQNSSTSNSTVSTSHSSVLISNSSVLTGSFTSPLLTVHRNDDTPPMNNSTANDDSPVLKILQEKKRQKYFLGKVLAILVLQHVFILCLVLIGTFNAPIYLIASADYLLWISLSLMFITSCFIVCLDTSLLRKPPVNITMLHLLTLTTGFLFASMAIVTESYTALWTIGTTAINVIVLLLFTFQSKWNLTTWNTMCMSLIVIQALNVIRIYVSHEVLLDLYLSNAIIMLYFFSIIYDFRLMVDRKHEIETSLKECSFVALNIHMDILIMYLLRRCFDIIRSGNYADQVERLISSLQDWYTVAIDSDFKACCKSDSPVVWKRRGHKNVHLGNRNTKEDDIYVSKLVLRGITYQDVGFYDCVYVANTSNINVSFYLYVDDPVNLMLGPSKLEVDSESYKPAVLPCRPTAPDVFVKLLTTTRELMADSTTQSPGPEERSIYFDPRQGFILPAHLMVPAWFIYICQFSKRGVIQEMNVDLNTWTALNWPDNIDQDVPGDQMEDSSQARQDNGANYGSLHEESTV